MKIIALALFNALHLLAQFEAVLAPILLVALDHLGVKNRFVVVPQELTVAVRLVHAMSEHFANVDVGQGAGLSVDALVHGKLERLIVDQQVDAICDLGEKATLRSTDEQLQIEATEAAALVHLLDWHRIASGVVAGVELVAVAEVPVVVPHKVAERARLVGERALDDHVLDV